MRRKGISTNLEGDETLVNGEVATRCDVLGTVGESIRDPAHLGEWIGAVQRGVVDDM